MRSNLVKSANNFRMLPENDRNGLTARRQRAMESSRDGRASRTIVTRPNTRHLSSRT